MSSTRTERHFGSAIVTRQSAIRSHLIAIAEHKKVLAQLHELRNRPIDKSTIDGLVKALTNEKLIRVSGFESHAELPIKFLINTIETELQKYPFGYKTRLPEMTFDTSLLEYP